MCYCHGSYPQTICQVKAFTLVELLVTITIIGLLGAISFPVLNQASLASKKAADVSAGKQTILAYMSYATDHDGALMKGYDASGAAYDITGNAIGGEDAHEAHRWPWRLAPYFNYNFYGATHVNEMASFIKSQGGLSQTYLVSVIPSLGMNAAFVGGNDYNGIAMQKKGYVATSMNQVSFPSKMAVFVSSRSEAVGKKYRGFYYVDSPVYPVKWSAKYDDMSSSKSTGYVSARYNDCAVVSFLDRHVSAMTYNELKDMRYWSKDAQQVNSSNWTPAK